MHAPDERDRRHRVHTALAEGETGDGNPYTPERMVETDVIRVQRILHVRMDARDDLRG